MNMHLTLNAHFKGANNLVQYMYFFRLDKNGYLLIAILSFVLIYCILQNTMSQIFYYISRYPLKFFYFSNQNNRPFFSQRIQILILRIVFQILFWIRSQRELNKDEVRDMAEQITIKQKRLLRPESQLKHLQPSRKSNYKRVIMETDDVIQGIMMSSISGLFHCRWDYPSSSSFS